MVEIFRFVGSCTSQILSIPLPFWDGLTFGSLLFALWTLVFGGKIVRLIFGADGSFLLSSSKDGKK